MKHEAEIETEMEIFSLTETEMFCKMETKKYKRESEHLKRNSN